MFCTFCTSSSGASVTVSRASRTARARPARLRHSCCLLRARQPSGRSGSTSTLLTASTERPHPLLPSGKHRAWCRRLASEYAVPVRQINLVFCKTQSTKRKTQSRGPWSPPSVPKDTRLAAPLLPEIRPQAEALLEALLLGVSEECALGTARSTSAGLLPLRAVCDGSLVRLLFLGSHVRNNSSRECLCGSRGHYFALERSGEMDNVVGAASSLLSAWNPCVHA